MPNRGEKWNQYNSLLEPISKLLSAAVGCKARSEMHFKQTWALTMRSISVETLKQAHVQQESGRVIGKTYSTAFTKRLSQVDGR